MGIRMKKLLPSHPWLNGRGSILLFLTLALAFLFVACGDDDSSSFVEPEKETSSSIAESSSEQGGGDPSSPSSSSSSAQSSSKNSSSSAKSSPSTDSKSSSSVTSSSSGTSAGSSSSVNSSNASSSSSSEEKRPCSEEGKKQRANGVNVICHDGYWVPVSSSSAVPTSSYFDMTNQFNEKVSYGEFTDPRDGQKYRTVSLKDGVYYTDSLVFFAENLNFGKMISGGAVQGDSTKYCYDDDPWYCENGWGGLYTWSRAMNLPSVCDSVELGSEKCNYTFAQDKDGKLIDGEIIHQGLCPEGWHIVNDGEWAYLQEKSGNSVAHYMGSKVAGFGSNDYGLSILPAGCWNPVELKYGNISKSALYWLPQQYPEYEDCAYRAAVRTNEFDRTFRGVKKQGFSVRCVKNY